MPIYKLGEKPMFPSGNLAEKDGLIAFGGKITVDFIIEAYSNGIFPWYNSDEPILWWCPNPRTIFLVDKIHISKSMKKLIKNQNYKITFDTAFDKVIENCKNTRKDTWINEDIIKVYSELYKLGLAHSVEVWDNNKLLGGLYGLCLGKVFFGESMFSLAPNTSKLALISLGKFLNKEGFRIIDCQVHNEHLQSLGAIEIGRREFLRILREDIVKKQNFDKWTHI